MNQNKYVIRVERKLRTELTVPFLDVAFHCENEQSVLYKHVRDFAPARGIMKNAYTANFKKYICYVKKQNWSLLCQENSFLYRIE